jgi:hypothetical protein
VARTVHCIKLGQEAEGLDFPPYPGELGKRLFENVSKQAWAGPESRAGAVAARPAVAARTPRREKSWLMVEVLV